VRRASEHVVRLSTVDVLAHEFLIPRLPAFQERFPGIELRIETSMRVVEFSAADVDVALRVRGHAKAGLAMEPVGPVEATPVCKLDLARRLREPADLANQTLIEMRSGEGSWELAFRLYGIDSPPRILALESYFETLTAAERGLGVAFGLFPMTTEWVQRRRLAVPFSRRVPVEGGVYLVFRDRDPRQGLFRQIAEWLRSEYAGIPPLPAGRVVPRSA
jgi:LysR family transcriptional regulator, glycine cleavage system transcriptional activator